MYIDCKNVLKKKSIRPYLKNDDVKQQQNNKETRTNKSLKFNRCKPYTIYILLLSHSVSFLPFTMACFVTFCLEITKILCCARR